MDGMGELNAAGVRPEALDVWPRPNRTPAAQVRLAPFSATLSSTAALLRRELLQVQAHDARVAFAGLTPGLIRKDGWPRADARLTDQGVVLRYDAPGVGPDGTARGKRRAFVYPCDTFDRWQDNLRAVALALEALRKVDRYGVTTAGEQYAGFQALPVAGPSRDEAARLLMRESGLAPIGEGDTTKDLYRAAIKRTHPDAGGTAERFQAVQDAYRVLGGRP